RGILLRWSDRAASDRAPHALSPAPVAVSNRSEGEPPPTLPRDLLVRLGNVNHLQNAGKGFESARVDLPVVPDQAYRRTLLAGNRSRLIPPLADGGDDCLDLQVRGGVSHHDQHGNTPAKVSARAGGIQECLGTSEI